MHISVAIGETIFSKPAIRQPALWNDCVRAAVIMPYASHRALVALGVVLATLPGARAEEAGQAALPEPAIGLDTLSVTATKTAVPAVDALAGTSVVPRAALDRLQPGRLSEVLRDVPGVITQENRNDPAQAINIRGLQDFGRVNVLVDGARQDFQVSGHGANGVFYLDPELVGGVDVTRGPTATVYGSGAIGGVAAFRTRSIDDILAPDESAGFVQKQGFGTNGQRFVNSSALGARIGTAADVFGQFVFRDTAPYRDGAGLPVPDTGSELNAGLAKLTLRPAEGHALHATALLQRFAFVNGGDTGAGARFANAVQADTVTFGYRFARPDVPLVDLSLDGYATTTRDALTFLQDSPRGLYGRLGTRAGDRLTYDLATAGFDAHNTARFETGPVAHALTLGGDGVANRVRTSDQAGGFGAAFTPSGRRELAGAFLQDEIRAAPWLRIVGALRHDGYRLDGGAYRARGARVSPKITVGVAPVGGLELYGTYAEGYRAPTITETLMEGIHPFPAFAILPNPALRPEVARTVEGGANLRADGVVGPEDALRAKLALFDTAVDGFIDMQAVGPAYYVPAIPGVPASICAARPGRFPCVIPARSYQYRNVARADLSGAELEGTYDWGRGFVSLAATHVDGRDRATRESLLTVPPDRIGTTLGLRFLADRLVVGTRLTLVEARTDLPAAAQSRATKAYGLVDLFATCAVTDRITADVAVQNVLDRRYRAYNDALASPGLAAKASLSIAFATR
ncbi:MAG: TonB-dependent hemoglobin/transferrin/lactoferrin family receptor [Methylobacterium sp.]|nr:MAG: TonB-dependent hemoglobin/transferrin/lactoferrin family receptor [Methylobacterium sp.]